MPFSVRDVADRSRREPIEICLERDNNYSSSRSNHGSNKSSRKRRNIKIGPLGLTDSRLSKPSPVYQARKPSRTFEQTSSRQDERRPCRVDNRNGSGNTGRRCRDENRNGFGNSDRRRGREQQYRSEETASKPDYDRKSNSTNVSVRNVSSGSLISSHQLHPSRMTSGSIPYNDRKPRVQRSLERRPKVPARRHSFEVHAESRPSPALAKEEATSSSEDERALKMRLLRDKYESEPVKRTSSRTAADTEHGFTRPERKDTEHGYTRPERKDTEHGYRRPERKDTEHDCRRPERKDTEHSYRRPERKDTEHGYIRPERKDKVDEDIYRSKKRLTKKRSVAPTRTKEMYDSKQKRRTTDHPEEKIAPKSDELHRRQKKKKLARKSSLEDKIDSPYYAKSEKSKSKAASQLDYDPVAMTKKYEEYNRKKRELSSSSESESSSDSSDSSGSSSSDSSSSQSLPENNNGMKNGVKGGVKDSRSKWQSKWQSESSSGTSEDSSDDDFGRKPLGPPLADKDTLDAIEPLDIEAMIRYRECKSCGLNLKTKDDVERHTMTQRHRIVTGEYFLENKSLIRSPCRGDKLQCTICNAPVSEGLHLLKHENSSQHRQQVYRWATRHQPDPPVKYYIDPT